MLDRADANDSEPSIVSNIDGLSDIVWGVGFLSGVLGLWIVLHGAA